MNCIKYVVNSVIDNMKKITKKIDKTSCGVVIPHKEIPKDIEDNFNKRKK